MILVTIYVYRKHGTLKKQLLYLLFVMFRLVMKFPENKLKLKKWRGKFYITAWLLRLSILYVLLGYVVTYILKSKRRGKDKEKGYHYLCYKDM